MRFKAAIPAMNSFCLVLLAITCSTAIAQPLATTANGMPILSPIDKTTIDVKDGTKAVQIPAGMVYVPVGKFSFGENETRELPAYAIARFEVTNAEYKVFADDTNYRGMPRYWKNDTYPDGKANHPVLFVSLVDAEAYCAWIKDGATAEGVIANFGGRLLNVDGKPISGAVIELWQADNNGCYIHSNGTQRGKERDAKFQGFGKIETNEKGEYRFRTIKPGLYTGRTIHWHVRVKQDGKSMLTTQLFIAGVPQNDRDGILRGMGTEEQRLSVIREFKPMSADSKEFIGTWDIVIGKTPEDPEQRRGGPGGRGGPPPGGPGGQPPRRRDSAEAGDQDIKELFFGPPPF